MSGILLHDAAIEFLTALQANGTPRGTLNAYRSHTLRLCSRYPGRKFATITSAEIANFLYGPKGISVGLSPGTGTNHRAALKAFFRHGFLMGWSKSLIEVPTPAIRSRGTRRPPTPPTRLTANQLLQVLEHADTPMMRAMIAVAINTALRASDVLKIQIGHLNLQTGELAVLEQKTGLFDILPVTLDLDEELRRYLIWYTEHVAQPTPEAFLFPAQRIAGGGTGWERIPDPTGHLTYEAARTWLKNLYATCGVEVEKKEVWHTLRRSVARIYFDSLRHDVSHDHALRQTAALLGHKQTSTTEKYLGLQAEIDARNESLRGRRFLVGTADRNVVPLRAAR